MNKKTSLKTQTLIELKQFDIIPEKELGQNFLIDAFFLEKLVKSASVTEESNIFEIGAGTGNLTLELARTGAKVFALEKDKRLVELLQRKLKNYDNVKIIQGDIKKINLPELPGNSSWKIVSNLPYYLTNPTIIKLLENKKLFESIVITIQLEVAERLTSPPGNKNYGAITLFSNYHARIEIIEKIPPEAFFPKPKVYSSVIRLTPLSIPPVKVENEKLFFSLIRSAFNMRRKTLRNALIKSSLNKWTQEDIDRVLNTSGIDGERRGETLSMEEFALLAGLL